MVRRANAMHIFSLLFACLGAAVAGRALALDMPEWLSASGALLLVAAGCAVIAVRVNRRQWGEFVARKLRITGQLETRVRELEARLEAAQLATQSDEAAFTGLAASVGPLLDAAQARGTSAATVAREQAPDVNTAESAKPNEDFIRLVSHEARTPLATIHAYSELLLDGEPLDDATRHDYFGIIHAETERLSLMLDSLLNLARMSTGGMVVRREPLSLNNLIAPAIHGAIALAELRKVAVDVDLAADADFVDADRELLTQATRNLLAHVVKHTAPGDRVAVRTRTIPADRNVLLEITGGRTGIHPKDLPTALDTFYGGGEKHDRHVPPGAAGLALSRRVIEALHGGTTFVRATGSSCTLGFVLRASSAAIAVPSVEVKDV